MPSAKASPIAAAWTNHSWLVTNLTTLPVPSGPHSITRPSSDRIGTARARSVSAPPANRVRRPVRAPSTAPVTGESTTVTPSGASAASSTTSAARLVVRSTHNDPGRMAPSPPPSRITATTWSGRGREVSSTSASAATAAALTARRPPAATTSATGSSRRSWAVTSYPAATSRRHIGRPMLPSPMKPIAVLIGAA